MQPYQQPPMMQPYQQPMMQPVIQPVYMAPPPQQQGPTIINIGGNKGGNGAQCPTCGH
jgi:hypothetical protein